MKNLFFLIVGILFIGGSIYLFLQSPAPTEESFNLSQSRSKELINIGEVPILVEIVSTTEDRVRGLSGRENLAWGEGMLFVFENPDEHGIWMKNMRFALDIAWLDEEGRIIWIERNVTPETYPKAFHPKEPAKYVLEVPSGFFSQEKIDIGALMSSS